MPRSFIRNKIGSQKPAVRIQYKIELSSESWILTSKF
jgi:hypothetical protein